MRKLRTDYLDLLLIHQPFGDYYGTYRAMEELYKAGRLRAIGVSNFGPDRYLDIQHFAEVKRPSTRSKHMCFSSRRRPKNISRNTAARSNPGARLRKVARICSPTPF